MNAVLLLLVIHLRYPCHMWKDGPQRWYVKSFVFNSLGYSEVLELLGWARAFLSGRVHSF